MSLKNVPLLFFSGCFKVALSRTPLISICLFIYTIFPIPFSLLLLVGILLLWRKQWVLSRFFLCIDARESLRNSKHRLISSHTFLLFLHSLYISNCWYVEYAHKHCYSISQLERQGKVWEREREKFFEGESEGHTCNCLMSACSTPCPHADKHNHCIFI